MGTWDVGPFDNHAACELLAELRDGTFDFEHFKRSCADSPLDVDEAEKVIALGALVNTPQDRLPNGVSAKELKSICTPQSRAWLRKRINSTLEPESSPVYALWETTGELEIWVQSVRASLP